MRFQNLAIATLAAFAIAHGRRDGAFGRTGTEDPVGLSQEAALAAFGVPDRILSSATFAEWRWGAAGPEQARVLFVDDCAVLISPAARAAFERDRRPALGGPVPDSGAYLGQPVAQLVARVGAAEAYASGPNGVTLTFHGGREATVIGGRVIGWE